MKIACLLIVGLISISAFSQTDNSKKSESWDSWFMPGGGYRTYFQKGQNPSQPYHGYMVDFVIYADGNVATYMKTPARMKFYSNLSILSSSRAEASDIFMLGVGANCAFEANISRKFLIPYFGAEVGGIFEKNFSSMQITPVAGVQIYSNQKIIWSLQGGYLYSLKQFNDYSGYNISSSVNFLLWN